MPKRSARRWSDNDKYFGPFTYAYSARYRPLAVVLSSCDEEGYNYQGPNSSTLRLSAFGFTLIAQLPEIVSPRKEKFFPGWDEATVARLGRNWYWDIDQREFGFSYSEGFLQVFRGRRTTSSLTDRTKSWFLPWTQWCHVRHSYYDLDGSHFWTEPANMPAWSLSRLRENIKPAEDRCPTVKYAFKDFDGEDIVATCRIEEREWRFGKGYFKWLSAFRRSMIKRSLCLDFSKETGRRKGSWKGGTLGHAIDMLAGEAPEAAFRRYCAEHEMKFVGEREKETSL